MALPFFRFFNLLSVIMFVMGALAICIGVMRSGAALSDLKVAAAPLHSVQTFSISGKVKNVSGRGLVASVTANPNLGGDAPTVATNSAGEYTIPNLKSGETYFLNATIPDVSFVNPDSAQIGPLTKNVTGVDFTAQFPLYQVAGIVCQGGGTLCNAGAQKLSGVTVTLTYKGGGSTGVPPVVTSSAGTYSFQLNARGDYVVTVSSPQFSFSKPSTTYDNILGNFLNEDYVGGTAKPLTTTSAASFSPTAVAPESIATGFGAGLTTISENATTIPLPTTLAGVSVRVRDALGTERLAPMFFAGANQVNYLIPQGSANGAATASVVNGSTVIATGGAAIASIAPGLFSLTSDGNGFPAATLLRVKAGGAQFSEPIATLDSQSKFVAVPIDFGDPSDQLFLILFGSGVRGRTNLSAVTATISNVNSSVSFAGPQGFLVGLDQINIPLNRSLQGRGEVNLFLTVDGVNSNTLKVQFK